jgi:hypothetical protein
MRGKGYLFFRDRYVGSFRDRLVGLLLCLTVLEISRGLVLRLGHPPVSS